jgi:hypothetical protein
MIRGLWDSMKSILALVLAVIMAVLVTAAAFFFKILPDRERQKRAEDAEARRRADAIKAEIAKAKEQRAADTKAAVSAIEQKAEAQKAQDSVALANELLAEGEK